MILAIADPAFNNSESKEKSASLELWNIVTQRETLFLIYKVFPTAHILQY